ncbi:MAG: DNA recombination protein RmuC, partial [Phycisphaerales bacterium]
MDGVSRLVGLLVGVALGGGAAYVITRSSGRSGQAAREASLASTVAARDQSISELKAQVTAERTRAEEMSRGRSAAHADQRAAEERLAEREKAFMELKASLELARAALTDAFKATGADVLKAAAETMMKQAKAQFEGQHKLSQQDLEARQKAIDAALVPLKEQLAKNEQLVKDLAEKREGDAKALGEQLKQIAELQQKASTAAQALSSAMRDNRQRGRWGEVSLRNVVEWAGMGEHVDFTEQTSLEGDEGAKLRPDMVVHLPGSRFIPIDAKVPMNAYFDAIDPALPDTERARRREMHASAVRAHMRTLVSRDYARENSKAFGTTAEITVMFVPVESALVAALEADPALFTDALNAKVIITTPSTLLALLRTCALQWAQARINDNARKIGDLARQLLERIGV